MSRALSTGPPAQPVQAQNNCQLSFGGLTSTFTVTAIRLLLCRAAELASLPQALQLCSPDKRSWLLQQAKTVPPAQPTGILCYVDGSYTASEQDNPQGISWACAFFACQQQHGGDPAVCFGVVSGALPAWVGDDQQPSAYMSECLALAYGAWVAARNFPGRDITFPSDCLAALGSAEATTAYDASGTTQGLHLLGHASSGGCIRYQYTPGHKGIFGNELVDMLAKAAAKGSVLGNTHLQGADVWLRSGAPHLPWAAACRTLRGCVSWPS